MESQIKRLYEGMFVLPQSFVREDQQAAFSMIEDLFKKFEADLMHIAVWAERSLAYEINHVREATYILTYFECETDKLVKIERAIRISDNILRCLIVKPMPGFNLQDYIENADREDIEDEIIVPEMIASLNDIGVDEVKS